MMRMYPGLSLVLVIAFVAVAVSTSSDETDWPVGMVLAESDQSFEETWSTLTDALESNENVRVIAEIDHSSAAEGVGLDLPPNRVVIFGNPQLGAPLMQAAQTVGIDLPQKIQVFVDDDEGKVFVGFNDVTYLRVRHRLGNIPTLKTIAGALRNFGGTAADGKIAGKARASKVKEMKDNPGLITVTSDASVDDTWDRLLVAIEKSPAKVAFTVDHQTGAASVGLDLRPTRLVAFGNPNLGTPLMQASPTSGIDLPIKMIVWEDERGRTKVTTNAPRFLKERHNIKGVDLAPIRNAVRNFLAIAKESRRRAAV